MINASQLEKPQKKATLKFIIILFELKEMN